MVEEGVGLVSANLKICETTRAEKNIYIFFLHPKYIPI